MSQWELVKQRMTQSASESLTYRASGVDIDKGDALARHIGKIAKATHRAGVLSEIGSFGALFDIKQAGFTDPILVSATDGVGTKLRLAIETGYHHEIGIDLVAMCVNDLLVQKAQPLFFLDYFACGALDLEIAKQVMAGIVEGCAQAGCALIGGETAEMPGMYQREDYDLAGFAVGAVERHNMKAMLQKDKIYHAIALPSSGLHSNGFSLVRRILQKANIALDAPPPFADESGKSFSGKNFGQLLLTPTRIYVETLLPLLSEENLIAASCHITGGGFYENLPRVMEDSMALRIDRSAIKLPEIFQWLGKMGNVATHELYRTFNMGIGMVLFTEQPDRLISLLQEAGESPAIIGQTEQCVSASAPQITLLGVDD